MNLLLDTQALLWSLDEVRRLGPIARAAVADLDNFVYVSAASAWEIAIKLAIGKLPVPAGVSTWLPERMMAQRYLALEITIEHAAAVENLPLYHADPFDRILIAQARVEGLEIVTADPIFRRYQVRVLRADR